jgi:hypothetical protein
MTGAIAELIDLNRQGSVGKFQVPAPGRAGWGRFHVHSYSGHIRKYPRHALRDALFPLVHRAIAPLRKGAFNVGMGGVKIKEEHMCCRAVASFCPYCQSIQGLSIVPAIHPALIPHVMPALRGVLWTMGVEERWDKLRRRLVRLTERKQDCVLHVGFAKLVWCFSSQTESVQRVCCRKIGKLQIQSLFFV